MSSNLGLPNKCTGFSFLPVKKLSNDDIVVASNELVDKTGASSDNDHGSATGEGGGDAAIAVDGDVVEGGGRSEGGG